MKRTKQKIATVGIGLIGLTALAVNSISFDTVMEAAKKLGVFNFTPHPQLEKIEDNEQDNMMSIAKIMYGMQMATEPEKRDAHAKAHGCVQAEFDVVPDLAEQYRVGLFSKVGQKFDAIIRYSNGSGQSLDGNKQPKHDFTKDGRGMAVKVLNATDGKNILRTGSTQDFMMIAANNFFVGSIQDYLRFQNTVASTKNVVRFIVERGLRAALGRAGAADAETASDAKLTPIIDQMLVIAKLKAQAAAATSDTEKVLVLKDIATALIDLSVLVKNAPYSLLETAKIMKEIKNLEENHLPIERHILEATARPIESSLTETYTSLTSYLLKSPTGEASADTAVKYISEPVDCATRAAIPAPPTPKTPDNKSVNYLAEDLSAQLSQSEKCFNFYIQPLPTQVSKTDKIKLVEDPRLDYSHFGKTTKVLVATIKIPAQKVNTAARNNYCERLSYNPWQALPEHQPLGALNRVRKVAVTASSIRRHIMSNTESKEPSSIEAFKDLQ